jgi:hypothetical protein
MIIDNNELDSQGRAADFNKGDRVFVLPAKKEATVIYQILHHDISESFWGNLVVEFDDGFKGTINGWQVEKLS